MASESSFRKPLRDVGRGSKAEEDLTGGQAVTLRERRKVSGADEVILEGGPLRKGANKRNATYLTQEEYDEDLAQLDILLHYVNNLSASLEFLQWENKRISTDLVPTLLDMYDALYAKLVETSNRDGTPASAPPPVKDRRDEAKPGDRELPIRETKFETKDSMQQRSLTAALEGCTSIDSVEVDHDYDIPESVEGGPSALWASRSPPYRPVSIISSSSSSSSSSSNSLPRGALGIALSPYLASAESLENELGLHSDAEAATKRRDRSLKARREKALRSGSGDSGVQCHIISLPVPPSLKPRYCDPDLDYMDRVVLEIVETEEVYVRDLKEVIEGYLEHWRTNPEQGVSAATIESLFSNIEQIYAFNRRFLTGLQKCGTDPVAVARCFVRNNSGFAIYTEYCTNYPKTVNLLTNLMCDERSMRACRERQLSLSHTLPLGSYLLKPVQRVLKYHLLLGNIVKHFGGDRAGHGYSPAHADIWNALSAMTGIAHHINDMKRKHEHAVRVQEIQSLLYGWQGEDLTTYGELAAEGTFKMFGFKGFRHVFLFDKMLLIAKRKDQNILMYKAHIMCSDLMLIESVPRDPLSFHVIPFDNPKCQYTLECRNLDQKREWTLQLKRVILENFKATIPAHARQLVMELGQSKSSGDEWKGGGRKSHHAPEYLERRKDKRRTSEGGLNARLRIRRSSRTRKDKEEKEGRSRSVSRTRDTDEETDSKHSSPADKSRLRLPMWRRRSEPGVGVRGRLRISSPSPESASTTLEKTLEDQEKEKEEEEEEEEEEKARDGEKGGQEASSLENVNESIFDHYVCEERKERENLEHIVSQLLQHQLQMQQIILSKQRRGLVRKKLGTSYEASDTETEETEADSRPPLPSSPPPPLSSTPNTPLPFPSDYGALEALYSDFEGTKNSWSSSFSSNPGSVSDTGFKTSKSSNYDNLANIWGGSGRKLLSRENSFSRYDTATPDKESLDQNHSFRRVRSFSNSFSATKNDGKICDDETAFPAQVSPEAAKHSSPIPGSSDVERYAKDRPFTIAIYDNETDRMGHNDASKKYVGDSASDSKLESPESRFSVENLISIHPDHKIYSKASVNKVSIRKVLNKLTNARGSPSKSVSEPSRSLSNIYVTNSELDRLSNRRSSGLVSTMARQCSKTLKERIKQIRNEDTELGCKAIIPQRESLPTTELLFSLPPYKQGSSSIGARLASSNELSDYAVPLIRGQSSKLELRPDSVLSSSSIWTSSSSSSNSSSKEAEIKTLLEEKDTALPSEADLSGDSFYEKSFEAIEAFLDDEMFRDSAIYSEPEDTPEVGFRGGGLTPKQSFSYRTGKMIGRSSEGKGNPSSGKRSEYARELFLRDILSPALDKKVPPPIPAKPDATSVRTIRSKGSLIQQQMKHLEERGGCYPDRCHDTLPRSEIQTEILEKEAGHSMVSKGWVRHVVGKLQQ